MATLAAYSPLSVSDTAYAGLPLPSAFHSETPQHALIVTRHPTLGSPHSDSAPTALLNALPTHY
jgi:hypothetical protein